MLDCDVCGIHQDGQHAPGCMFEKGPDGIPRWLGERMIRNAHLYNKAGRLAAMPTDNENDIAARLAALKIRCDGNHGGPPCADPECWAREEPGLVGEIPPLKLLILPPEAEYLTRLLSVDHQRMIENVDHARSYGSRNFQPPPEWEMAANLLHSLAMARTSATIEALEALEEQRADTAALAEAKPGGSA